MPWIHVAAATLLVLGTAALFAFLKWVERLEADADEAPDLAPGVTPLRWPPPPAVAAGPPHTPRVTLAAGDDDGTAWRRAA